MRGTLSQRRDTKALRRLRAGIAAFACAWSLSGCDRNDVTESSSRSGSNQAEAAATPTAPFEWPSDPSHPVLELTVESAAGSGTILIELMPELAPSTVVKILELADAGDYDGTTFHRVVPGFMIQGGDPNSRDRDPTNDGTGGANVTIQDEFTQAPFLRGVVGMGNRGRENSSSTQFFIMQKHNEGLTGRYNAVGRVLRGIELVDAITTVKIDRSGRWGPKDRPLDNVVMTSVRSIGQIAAVTETIEPESDSNAIAFTARSAEEDGASKTRVSDSRDAPAAPAGEDWERLEAGGR